MMKILFSSRKKEDLKNSKKRKFKNHILLEKTRHVLFNFFLFFLYYYKIEKSYFIYLLNHP